MFTQLISSFLDPDSLKTFLSPSRKMTEQKGTNNFFVRINLYDNVDAFEADWVHKWTTFKKSMVAIAAKPLFALYARTAR